VAVVNAVLEHRLEARANSAHQDRVANQVVRRWLLNLVRDGKEL
jgi:hypothetical protein